MITVFLARFVGKKYKYLTETMPVHAFSTALFAKLYQAYLYKEAGEGKKSESGTGNGLYSDIFRFAASVCSIPLSSLHPKPCQTHTQLKYFLVK